MTAAGVITLAAQARRVRVHVGGLLKVNHRLMFGPMAVRSLRYSEARAVYALGIKRAWGLSWHDVARLCDRANPDTISSVCRGRRDSALVVKVEQFARGLYTPPGAT